jgi:hypothetical protein
MVMSKGLATAHPPPHYGKFQRQGAFRGRTDHNREKMGTPAGGMAPRLAKKHEGFGQMHSWGILAQTTAQRPAGLCTQR